ncbi:hypothetical protein WJX77_010457 [Trebouxia sp. C0004]
MYLDLVIGKGHDAATLQILIPMLSERLGSSTDGRILDIASHAGTPAIPIAKTFPHASVVCTDLSTVAVNYAKQRAKDQAVCNITFQAADAQHLENFDDNSFNVTTCILGLMFMPDHKSALQEAFRVLQPGGIYMASVWGPLPEFQAGQMILQLMNQLMTNQPPMPPNPMTPWRFGDSEVLQQDLKDAGFSVVTCTPFSHPMKYAWADLVTFLLGPHGQLRPMLTKLKTDGRSDVDEESEEMLRSIVQDRGWICDNKVELHNTALMFTAVKT